MNAPEVTAAVTITTALADRCFGWVVEQWGLAAEVRTLVSSGRNRQLRATVALRCARAKAHANASMRSWKLCDARLLNIDGARCRTIRSPHSSATRVRSA